MKGDIWGFLRGTFNVRPRTSEIRNSCSSSSVTVLRLTFVFLSSPSSFWLCLYLFPPLILTLFYSLSVSSSLFLSLSFKHTYDRLYSFFSFSPLSLLLSADTHTPLPPLSFLLPQPPFRTPCRLEQHKAVSVMVF